MSLSLLRADLIPLLNNDDGPADAARVSMAKQAANFTEAENTKLLGFLNRELHWSPYGHARETFKIVISLEDWAWFLENAILAGFAWCRDSVPGVVTLDGSLWAWKENLVWMPSHICEAIITELYRMYPRSAPILFPDFKPVLHSSSFVSHAVYDEKNATLVNASVQNATFRVASSIFIARQFVKHQVHLCWNEESRRYISDPVEFYEGDLRKKGKSIKQGSSDELIDKNDTYKGIVHSHHKSCEHLYNALLAAECAPEVARGVLPLNSITNWVWTGSLRAWARVCKQRCDGHAQKEAEWIANQIDHQLEKKYGTVWLDLRAGK